MSVALVLGLGAHFGIATAQTTPAQSNRSDAEIRSERTANLSGADQLREASHVLEIISAARQRVSNELDRARSPQERDIIKVNCLNDKLTQIDVALRSAREHMELLQSAVSINNDGQRNHEFTLMTIFRSRVEGLSNEANTCAGELDTGTFGRGTLVFMRVSDLIPVGDVTELRPEALLPDRPLVTSPML